MPHLPRSKRPAYRPAPVKRSGNNSPNAKLYNSTRWRKYTYNFRRDATIERNGYGCEVCYQVDQCSSAEITDHIIQIEKGGAIWDKRNHMAMCKQCHQVKRSREANNFTIDVMKGADGLIPADRTQVYSVMIPGYKPDNE